jgi:NAD(P)-dependent dehydrogenase (short-subunit alcohol dehydrogenase family)
MKIDLSGRMAIITGSTAGIGRATAEGLARAGATVIVNGRTQARVDQAVQQMRAAFPECAISGIAADLSTPEGANAFIAQAPDADIVVNKVGTAFIRDYYGVEDIAASHPLPYQSSALSQRPSVPLCAKSGLTAIYLTAPLVADGPESRFAIRGKKDGRYAQPFLTAPIVQ